METILQTERRKMKPNNDPNNNVVVYYDEVNRWLFVSCANQPKLRSIKRSFNRCLVLAAQHQCSRLILDGYAMKYTAKLLETSDWLTKEWLPVAEKYGLRHIAQLVPPEVNQKVLTTCAALPNVRIESFQSLVDAVKWLYAQK